MESKNVKLLTKLIQQYAKAHQGSLPIKIVVEPLALVALGLKQSVAPSWGGVPVECRDFSENEVVEPAKGNSIGVSFDTRENQVVACSLYTV
jgi:hypothetical protein